MLVVINKCFGGFGLSARAVKAIADRKGRPCYFFKTDFLKDGINGPYRPITIEEADDPYTFMFSAFDLPNPNEVLRSSKLWHEMSMDERQASNARYSQHSLPSGREVERTDPDLIAVVRELGDAANGRHAKLAIVEIPDGTDYVLDEYDGIETIHEAHRSWS